MGGNALVSYGINTVRFQKQDYQDIVREVSGTLREKCNWKFYVIEAYREKESFGDMDMVILQEDYHTPAYIKEFLLKNFGAVIVHRNSNTYSFAYKNFQIDLIFQPIEFFKSCCDYYNYSPSGNAVGKLYHQFKLSYGHEGLKYIIREEDVGANPSENSHVMKEVILSQDTREIHEILGLDHDRYIEGFDTEDEIFAWVCTSPFFNPELFSFEEMNHRARTRDRKRPDYNRLMVWIKRNQENLPKYEREPDKRLYFPWILEAFPALKEDIAKCWNTYRENALVKSKFNGKLVLDWIGLVSGKELGDIIKKYRMTFTDFRNFLLTNDEKAVELHFRTWYLFNIHEKK
jgi:hypothetical protein